MDDESLVGGFCRGEGLDVRGRRAGEEGEQSGRKKRGEGGFFPVVMG